MVSSSITASARVAAHLARWIGLAVVIGTLAGVASFVFLEALDWATDTREANSWIVLLLPVAGFVVGAAYHHLGGRSIEGNALLLDQIHEPTEWVPRRMAPLVLVGTVVSQLFGASVGREGTALQMSGSMADAVARALRMVPSDRRVLLIAALAGGFGSVFGVPLAGAVFALEVQAVGRIRYDALVPALTASVVGDLVVRGLGHDHLARAPVPFDLDAAGAAKVAVAGVAFGLASALFIVATHRVRTVVSRAVGYHPLRLVVGGVATIGLALVFGQQYLGLSLPLISDALGGQDPGAATWALKLLFTVVALGCGFPGGEVTPLFVIGATLGGALAGPLGLDVSVLAAVGFVAVFAGAANTPLACSIMAAELFGSDVVVVAAVGCVVAYVCSSHRSIYSTQRVAVAKGPSSPADPTADPP